MGFNNYKILIIKLGAIGDLLMTTPAIRALKKAYPTTHISLLAGKSSKMTVNGNQYIDELIECDDYIIYKARFLQKARYALSLFYLLRKKKFDAVIVFHRDWRFNFFAFLCGIPERVGFDRNGEGRFLTKKVMVIGIKHNIDQYLEVVKAIGIHDDGRDMDFAISKEAENVADKMLQTGGVGKGDIVIGILAGGASNIKTDMPIKRWPLENYIELSNQMAADGCKVILLGAESDRPNADAILKHVPEGLNRGRVSHNILDLTGKTTLEETAAVMKRCNLIVAHDSGPMHLASAVGVPVISIFGPTDPREYYPLSPNSYYFWNVENIKCAPCYKDGEFPDCQNPICMNAVTVEQVYQKIGELIIKRGVNN
ncbi:MAG: lipopolysaccharide heptosyltransferase II [Deltaproteobacteria bacterium]|nr:lipopolysaccharide heptosyltransferase II [Deltaproteobacteria bacterium]